MARSGSVCSYWLLCCAPENSAAATSSLAALIGLMFGFPHVLWALLLGIVAGGVFAIGLLARRQSRKLQIPYAPFLCLGAIVALLYNPLAAFFHL